MNSTMLFVSDIEFSALSIAARSRAEIQGAEVIYASMYLTPALLTKDLIARRPQLIVFSWRQALIDILNVTSAELLKLLRSHSVLVVLIPDHLGISTKLQTEESKLLNYVDYYLVTSDVLFEIYSNSPGIPKPASILHDIPNVDLIRKVRREEVCRKHNQVAWVGNSKWGINQGFNDHKGFSSVILPLSTLFEEHNMCASIEIIDSAENRKSNIEVLRAIRASSLLLHSSISEGTGLPILEALGLGITPITTDVGIASEVLGMHRGLIVSRDSTVFHNIVHKELIAPSLSEEEAIQIFEKHIYSISSEGFPTNFQKVNKEIEWLHPNFIEEMRTTFVWIVRFFKNIQNVNGF